MKKKLQILLLIIPVLLLSALTFYEYQLNQPRVKQAHANHINNIKKLLDSFSIDISGYELYLRGFKSEKQLECWAKNIGDKKYQLIKTFPICRTCGDLGPKRRQGDRQIPEGHYHIDTFNPQSKYHLSMRVDYPNKSDSIFGENNNLGGDIYIHGKCYTIGCLPLGDNNIEYLYMLCLLARQAGQEKIPVTIFPIKLSDIYYQNLLVAYPNDNDRQQLWLGLKKIYQEFNASKEIPDINIDEKGHYII
jgi:murein L,D-transpeptidase YafK